MPNNRTWIWLVVGWILAGIFVSFSAVLSPTTNVSLAWNPVSTAASYNLYSGTNTRQYSNVTNVGRSTNGTVNNLVAGKTYYFAVTALASNGLESQFSNEAVLDTNVYVTNWITLPWYQTQYGPSLKGTNWANIGAAWRGQFTNLPSAFLRLLWLSNQVIGFTVQTNPPLDTGVVQNILPFVPSATR